MKLDNSINNVRIINRFLIIEEEFREVHGNKYSYNNSVYKGQKTKLIITCPTHGEFSQTPENHLKGGCKKCADFAKGKEQIQRNADEFISKAQKIHGFKYDYAKIDYKGNRKEVTIICSEHGEFNQKPMNHLSGKGCIKCGLISKARSRSEPSRIMFKEKAIGIHGNVYDYSKVLYINKDTDVLIICPYHGEFSQKPHNHVAGKQGCPKCGNEKRLKNNFILAKQNFYKNANKIHGDKYDYSEVNYVNAKENIIIKCKIHGEFKQAPDTHISGAGCPKCAGIVRLTNEEFIIRANEIHKKKYDYSRVNYINAREKIDIICPEHGTFDQIAYNHLIGRGCPNCATSGFDKEKPAILYYLKISSGLAYKIGITNRSVEERFIGEMDQIEILKIWNYEKGIDALKQESQILTRYAEFLYIGPDILKSGNTELFDRNILEI